MAAGRKTGGGSRKGRPNRLTADVKAMILGALQPKGGQKGFATEPAQQWFLAALACDPRNVEALVGVALTCQHLVSNPWWGDPLGAAAASASDLGREAVALALERQPGHALAHCVQGMLYSAVGELEQAEAALRLALAIDPGLGSAHAFLGYNRAALSG
jgi:hypothetical protein